MLRLLFAHVADVLRERLLHQLLVSALVSSITRIRNPFCNWRAEDVAGQCFHGFDGQVQGSGLSASEASAVCGALCRLPGMVSANGLCLPCFPMTVISSLGS